MSILTNNTVTRVWDFLFVELADPRTNDFPLLRNPLPGLSIIVFYLYFVLSWGPSMMENRKPFKMQSLLVLYNFLQVLLSTYLVYEALDGVWLRHYNFKCAPVDWSVSPLNKRICNGYYMYFLAKLTELLDTVFFVLRKKNSQITFLHIYHHAGMAVMSWGVVKYYPGGHSSFEGLINSFVHIWMYSYYLMSALGPKYQPYLGWKKYVTWLQMSQFLICFYHWLQLLWVPCDYTLWSLIFTLPNSLLFFYLFADFYVKTYWKSSKAIKKVQENNNEAVKEDKLE